METAVIVIVLWVIGSIVVYIYRSVQRKNIQKEMPDNDELGIYINQLSKMKSQNSSYVDSVNYLKKKGIKSQKLIDSIISSVESQTE